MVETLPRGKRQGKQLVEPQLEVGAVEATHPSSTWVEAMEEVELIRRSARFPARGMQLEKVGN